MRRALRLACAVALSSLALVDARAQSMEPLAYHNAPIGLNFLIAGYTHWWGNVLTDPSLPIQDVNATIDSATVAYDRVLDFWGQSGSVAFIVPYAHVHATGEVFAEERSVTRDGLADVMMRMTVNLYGAPALSLGEYRSYRQDTIAGVSLYVTAPTGQYDGSKLINIGTHRWSLKPEFGVSKAIGAWTLEGSGGVTFFTTNNDFLGGKTRRQDPIYSVQGHAIYNVDPTLWMSVDATYYTGGSTTVDGERDNDRQSNSRYGATLSKLVGAEDSVKLYYSSGATARFGSNFRVAGLAWQHRWGAGL
jgi:hypothetical protein